MLSNIWKIISQFLGPLAFILAMVFGIKQCHRADVAESRKEIVTEYITEVNIDTIRDSEGLQHAIFKNNEIDRETIKQAIADSVGSKIDSIIYPYKDKIKELTVVNSKLEARMKGIRRDTVVIYKDEVIDWRFDTKTDSLSLLVNLKPSYLKYSDGKQLLGFNIGTQNLYTDFWWNDPRIKINSINNVTIKNEIPKNNILLSGKSEYRFNSQQLWLGSEAEIKINKIGLYGNYMYNPIEDSHEKSAGFKYYIFK